VAASFALAAVVTESAAAAPGDLDLAFGTGGIARFRDHEVRHTEAAFAPAGFQSGGRAIAAGNWIQAHCFETFCAKDYAGAVLRLLPDGSVDTSFGHGGTVRMDARVTDSVVDEQGRILVATYSVGNQVLVRRLLPDGATDPSFGASGTATIALADRSSQGDVILAMQGDRIVVGFVSQAAGSSAQATTVTRLLDDGSPDDTFGTGGLATGGEADARAIHSMAVDSENRIVTGEAAASFDGGVSASALVRRLTPNGDPDPSFGTAGSVTIDTPELLDQAVAAIGPGDTVLALTVGGRLFRLQEADGSPDPGFGQSGSVATRVPTAAFGASPPVTELAVQSGGGVLVAGSSFPIVKGHGSAMSLTRIGGDGATDPAFGSNGLATTYPPRTPGVPSIALAPGGKLLWLGNGARDLFAARFETGAGGPDDLDADSAPDGVDRCPASYGPPGGCAHLARELRLRRRGGAIAGVLHQPEASCTGRGSRAVILMRRPGRDAVLARADLAKARNQAFPIERDLPRAAAVYARVKRHLEPTLGICEPVRSRVLRTSR
jgi:uncharacterized delta-60 repeat protein